MSPGPDRTDGPPRRRGLLEVRWRQLRNPPRPVVRAVASSLSVAVVLGIVYLAYDVALERGATLPGGDLRPAAVALYVALVLAVGTVVTWLVVPQPSGAGRARRRSAWSGVLGFLAAIPIAYLVLVVEGQLLRPLLG